MRGAILCPICHQSQRLCTRRHGQPYTVIDTRTEERGTFKEARDVKLFMWGRDFLHYRILKNGVLFPWTDGDLHAFEQELEAG